MDKVRFALSWLFYWLGDLVSRTPDTKLYWIERGLYAAYTFFMDASIKLQGDGKGPWTVLDLGLHGDDELIP